MFILRTSFSTGACVQGRSAVAVLLGVLCVLAHAARDPAKRGAECVHARTPAAGANAQWKSAGAPAAPYIDPHTNYYHWENIKTLRERAPAAMLLPGFLRDAESDAIVGAVRSFFARRRVPLSGGYRKVSLPPQRRELAFLQPVYERLAEITGYPPSHMEPMMVKERYADNEKGILNLHHDWNQQEGRVLTAVLYFSNVEGGETVFPGNLAETAFFSPSIVEPDTDPFHSLFTNGTLHVGPTERGAVHREVFRAGKHLCRASDEVLPKTATRVAPQKNTALLFASVTDAAPDAAHIPDAHAWHGVCLVQSGTRWSATIFIRDRPVYGSR